MHNFTRFFLLHRKVNLKINGTYDLQDDLMRSYYCVKLIVF